MLWVYSDSYYADMLGHVFSTDRYHLLYQRMTAEGLANAQNNLAPRPATREELALVHTDGYLDDILSYRATPATISGEIPLNEEIVSAFILATGGTIVAAEKAIEGMGVINLGGGFHHAFPDHAEGFCLFNDIAVAIRSLRQKKYDKKILVVDCDLHQGNGTAFIFRCDPSVFTFSIHQENNYPVKQRSDLDIGLEDGTEDEEYLSLLEAHIPTIFEKETPSLLFYVAGGDPFIHDQLGGLSITMEGLFARDRLVLSWAKRANCGVVIVLAGGYAQNPDDTVQIHFQTACALREIYGPSS